MTLANDVKAKLAFQPGDGVALAQELHELEEGFVAYLKIINPVAKWGSITTVQKGQEAIDALWLDYLVNGITQGMAVRALLTVTK